MTLVKFRTIKSEPLLLLKQLLDIAMNKQIRNANSMILATNKPSARIVLLKELNEEGLVFFSNYNSNKAKEIDKDPNVAINFYWAELDKQVRIEGKANRLDEQKSIDYFVSRPRESKIAAWASKQSVELTNYNDLLYHVKDLDNKFLNKDIPKPDFWGGYIVKPKTFEFWEDMPNRLHKRTLYSLNNNNWIKTFLYP